MFGKSMWQGDTNYREQGIIVVDMSECLFLQANWLRRGAMCPLLWRHGDVKKHIGLSTNRRLSINWNQKSWFIFIVSFRIHNILSTASPSIPSHHCQCHNKILPSKFLLQEFVNFHFFITKLLIKNDLELFHRLRQKRWRRVKFFCRSVCQLVRV